VLTVATIWLVPVIERAARWGWAFALLLLGQTDGTDFGFGERRTGHRRVVRALVVFTQDRDDRDVGLIHTDVREESLPGDITDSPQLVARDHVVVDLDVDQACVCGQSDRVESETTHVDRAAHRHQRTLGAELSTVVQHDHGLVAVTTQLDGPTPRVDGNALRVPRFRRDSTGLGLPDRQHPIEHLDPGRSLADTASRLVQ